MQQATLSLFFGLSRRENFVLARALPPPARQGRKSSVEARLFHFVAQPTPHAQRRSRTPARLAFDSSPGERRSLSARRYLDPLGAAHTHCIQRRLLRPSSPRSALAHADLHELSVGPCSSLLDCGLSPVAVAAAARCGRLAGPFHASRTQLLRSASAPFLAAHPSGSSKFLTPRPRRSALAGILVLPSQLTHLPVSPSPSPPAPQPPPLPPPPATTTPAALASTYWHRLRPPPHRLLSRLPIGTACVHHHTGCSRVYLLAPLASSARPAIPARSTLEALPRLTASSTPPDWSHLLRLPTAIAHRLAQAHSDIGYPGKITAVYAIISLSFPSLRHRPVSLSK
ncbi:hypothetical protein L1887_61395 [Cichorium endivia]|nr:hypothetical protein L1887_61395 [Cichorium endivia]